MADIYGYEPGKPLAVVAAALFLIGAIIHTIQMARYKTWYMSAFTIGAYMMTTGYIFRFASAYYPNNVVLYAAQNLFIILTPTFSAATLYTIYGRLAQLVNEPRASILNPQMSTKLFICLDIFSFLTQCGGGGMLTSANMSSVGARLTLFGLVLQLFSFTMFLSVALTFHVRMRGVFTVASLKRHGRWNWRHLLYATFAASILIILRCSYRIAEFSQTHGDYLMKHEGFTYLLDTLPMFIVQTLFNVFHPGQAFPKAGSEDEVMEVYIKLDGTKVHENSLADKKRSIYRPFSMIR